VNTRVSLRAALVLLATATVLPRVGLTANHEPRDIVRPARVMAMGGAFVAVADDENAIFFNPAGLGQIKTASLNLLPLTTEVSYDLVLPGLQMALGNSAPLTNMLMGSPTNFLVRAQLTPSFVLPGFGIAFILDQKVGLITTNTVFPRTTSVFQTTDGLQAAFGRTIFRAFRGKGELSVGVGGKVLWRRGGYRDLSYLEFLQAGTNGLTNYVAALDSVYGGFGMGYGFDVGVLYTQTFRKRLKLKVGLASTDLGDIEFSNTQVDKIYGNTSAGVAVSYATGSMTATFAYDYRNAFDDIDWRKRNHLGLDLSFPFIKLYGGINGVFPTYGAAFDIWLIRFTGLAYTEETGALVYQNPNWRFMLRADLKISF